MALGELNGNYNITYSLYNASDFGASTATTLRLVVCGTQNGTYKTVGSDLTANTTTLAKASWTFDLSTYVTPASLQKIYFKFQMLDSSGNILINSPSTNDAMKTVFGSSDYATMAYAKANEPPSLSVIKNNGNTYDINKPMTLVWSTPTQTGSFAPHHYKIWLKISYDGAYWESGNNYIAPNWGVEGTSWTVNLSSLALDTKGLANHSRVFIGFQIATVDNTDGILSEKEATRSTIKMTQIKWCINSRTNVVLTDGVTGSPIEQNSIKKIPAIDNLYGDKLMTLEDGSEWTRIFWHDISTDATYFTNESEASTCSLSNRMSRLGHLNYNFEKEPNGEYEFLLRYPKYSTTKYNRWIQTANPYYTTANASQTAATMGYRAIHIDFTNNWYYGMGLSSSPTKAYMDTNAGSGTWYGGLGQLVSYTENGITGFPAPYETGMAPVQKEVELWVRTDNSVKVISHPNDNLVEIFTAEDFANFIADINSNPSSYENKTVKLRADISIGNETSVYPTIQEFYGILDGNYHTITCNTGKMSSNYGVIDFIFYNYGTIKDLILDGGQIIYDNPITAEHNGLGAFCNMNYGLIFNCINKRSMYPSSAVATSACVGGFCGYNFGHVARCVNQACIGMSKDAGITVGGIVGKNSGIIEGCKSEEELHQGQIVGGICGYTLEGSIIRNCYSTDYLEAGENGYMGGIVGYSYKGLIANCYTANSLNELGMVEFTTTGLYYGGICGYNNYGTYSNNYYDSLWGKGSNEYTAGVVAGTSKTASYMDNYASFADELGSAYISAYDDNEFPTDNEAHSFYYRNSKTYTNGGYHYLPIFAWEKVSSIQKVASSGLDFNYYASGTNYETALILSGNKNLGRAKYAEITWGIEGSSNILKTKTPMYYNKVSGYDDSWYGAHLYITVKYEYGEDFSDGYFYPDNSGAIVCFLEGTPILTSSGLVPIEKIKVGDYVLSKNEVTEEVEEQKVYNIYNHNSDIAYSLILENDEEIVVTESHTFYIKDKGEVAISQIKVGDILIDKDNQEIVIKYKSRKRIDKPVYEIWVENNRNYFVGNSSILAYSEREVIK